MCYVTFSTPSQILLNNGSAIKGVSTLHHDITSQQVTSSSLPPVTKSGLLRETSTSSSTALNQLKKRDQNPVQPTNSAPQRHSNTVTQQQHPSLSPVTNSSLASSCQSTGGPVALKKKARPAPLPPELSTTTTKQTSYTVSPVDTHCFDVHKQRAWKENQG